MDNTFYKLIIQFPTQPLLNPNSNISQRLFNNHSIFNQTKWLQGSFHVSLLQDSINLSKRHFVEKRTQLLLFYLWNIEEYCNLVLTRNEIYA